MLHATELQQPVIRLHNCTRICTTSFGSLDLSSGAYSLSNLYASVKHNIQISILESCFGGLEVACWPLVLKFAGSLPAEAIGFLGRKNPQHAFLRRGSKAVGPMS